MNKIVIALCGIALAISSCSSTLVRTKNPEQIKKVAVISAYLNGVWRDAENEKDVWSRINQDLDIKKELANLIRTEAETKLAKTGWTVVPYATFSKAKAYTDLVASLKTVEGVTKYSVYYDNYSPKNFITQLDDKSDFIPADALNTLHTQGFDKDADNNRKAWGRFAKDLGVDAVIVLDVTLALKTDILGDGHAKIKNEIVAIDQAGDEVINTNGGFSLDLGALGGGDAVQTKTTTLYVGVYENAPFTPKAKDLFKEGVIESITKLSERIVKELTGEKK